MSIRPVDFNGMIQRTQDVSTLKQNEDNRPVVEQQTIFSQEMKKVEQNLHQGIRSRNMTMIEIILLLVGCVFMIGSFFISEKLSSSELNKIAELSEDELKKIIEREVNNAGTQMDEVIGQKIEEAGEQAERAMEKESNEQIMQIHEYSETVMESMKKTHDEIMFLYSMLNDKHTEMTSMTGDLQRLAADIRNLQENLSAKAGTSIRKPVAESHVVQQPVMKQNAVVQPMTETIDVQPEPEVQVNRFQEIQEPEQKTEKPETADAQGMSNDMILKLYEQGLSKVEIAKQLGRGLGEVNLVIELYKGDENL